MRNLLVIMLIWLGLCSCVSRRIEVTPIGVMQLRTHRMTDHIDWESNTWVDKEEMCPPLGADCISAKQLEYEVGDGLLWVGINEYLSPETPHGIYFFDTKTGVEIPCSNCVPILKEWRISDGYWLGAPQRYVSFCGTRNGQRVGMFIATVKDAKMDVQILPRVAQEVTADTQGYGYSTSPDNSNLAWYECSPKCTLYWLNADYSRILSEATVCASKDLEIYWQNGRPMNGFFGNTSKFETCRDAKGELMYPLQPWKR